jgi:hypothetical protein
LSRRVTRRTGFWLLFLRIAIISNSFIIWRLHWQAQLVAWPAVLGILVWLAIRGRSADAAQAPPVPDVSDLAAADLPASGRAADLAAAPVVRAAGTNTVGDVLRNSVRARGWHPGGDPEADRAALLAGQAFRVAAWRKSDGRWGRGHLEIGGRPLAVSWRRDRLPLRGPRRARGMPFAPPAQIVLTRRADLARDRFPANDRLFTVLTVRARDATEMLAIPTLDVPLVHAALELANAEAGVQAAG